MSFEKLRQLKIQEDNEKLKALLERDLIKLELWKANIDWRMRELKGDTHEYCKECDCILRWDEAETLCKSCEERKEDLQLPEDGVQDYAEWQQDQDRQGDKDCMKPEYAQGILDTYVGGDKTKLLILCNLIELSLGRDTQVFEWLRRYNKEEREWLLHHLNKLQSKSTDE